MQKLKAAFSVMLKEKANHKAVLAKTKQKYLQKQTLWHDSDYEDTSLKREKSDDPFDVFMSQDEYEVIQDFEGT